MKKILVTLVLLFTIFSTTTFAQSISVGTGYSTFYNDDYNEVFENSTLRGFGFEFLVNTGDRLSIRNGYYFFIYPTKNDEIVIDEDTLATTTGLRNFGIDFGGMYYFTDKEKSLRPFVSTTSGFGYFHAKQTTRNLNEADTNVGNAFVRVSASAGLRYNFSEQIGIMLAYVGHANYYFPTIELKSRIDTKRLILQSAVTLNILYSF